MRDMQQMYELWLSLTNQNRRPDGTLLTPPPEEKQSTMPAEYTEAMVGSWKMSLSFILRTYVFCILKSK